MQRQEIISALNALLEPEKFKDYAPNGLQVEGASEVTHVVCGVSASQALIDHAVKVGAQMILVHHGYFWKGENPCITGIKKARLQKILANNINLVAFHLPLDANEQLGNNAEFGRLLEIDGSTSLDGEPLVRIGRMKEALTVEELARKVGFVLAREPMVVPSSLEDRKVQTVAWCSGAAQDYLEAAAQAGADVYISGEISERTVLEARELDIPYFCVGHHASETLGIAALAEWLQIQFPQIHVEFLNVLNPV